MTETVLRLLGEGGSITLEGREAPGGEWQFRLAIDEAGLADLLDEEPAGLLDEHPAGFLSNSGWVEGWPAALRLLDERQWWRLSPDVISERFRGRILDAVRERTAGNPMSGIEWGAALKAGGGADVT